MTDTTHEAPGGISAGMVSLSLCNNAGLMSFIFTAFLWMCQSMFVFYGFTDLVSLAVCFLAGSEVLCFVS